MWQCGSALHEGSGLANIAVREFHQRLNAGQYEAIYRQADVGFTREGKHDEMVKFLAAVHAKLGDAGATNLVNIRVNATTNGTFLTAEYNTTFARGSAVEMFTWIKKSGNLALHGYNIQSNVLVLN